MAVIVNGDGILTGVSSLTTALDDITSGRGTVTGVATVGTLQLGTGVSISSPRTQNAAIFTNNSEFLTVDDAGRVGVGTVTPNSDAHPQNVGKINVGFITARSVAGDIDANTLVVAGLSTFTGVIDANGGVTGNVTGNVTGDLTGTASGNAVLTGSTNNQLVTVTGSNAITGEGNLTYDGSVLQVAADANAEGIEIVSSGDTYNDIVLNANRSAANAHIGRIVGEWNGGRVAAIILNTGGDTSSKDDGEILFATSNGGSSLTTRALIRQDGKIHVRYDGSNPGNDIVNIMGGGDGITIARSTSNASDGNILGNINFHSYMSGSYHDNAEAKIQALADSGQSGSNAPTHLDFYTKKNGVGPGASPAQQMRIQSDGSVKIFDGDLIIGTSGHGIDFSATNQASGMQNELLDDYEEGSYTPTFANVDQSVITVGYYHYTKVGRLVHIDAKFSIGSNNDGSTFGFTVPFTQAGSRQTHFGAISNRSSPNNPFCFTMASTQSYIYARALQGFGSGDCEYVDFQGSDIIVSGTYESN